MPAGSILLGIVIAITIVRVYHYGQCRIRKLQGIEQNYYIDVRGTKQYLQIRGNNVNNPVILILNSGNSKLQNYMTYRFREELIDEYTVVYWDQRGCGRTYYANKRMTMNYSESIEDLEFVAEYLCKRFHREKIILIGYEWGSLLGVDYISRHPEKVQAYVSVGQFIEWKSTLEKTAERVLNVYEKNKRGEAHKVFSLLSKVDTDNVMGLNAFPHYFLLIQWFNRKLYPTSFLCKMEQMWQVVTSPDLQLRDLRWIMTSFLKSYHYQKNFEELITEYQQSSISERFGNEFDVPFYLLYGEYDYFVDQDMITEFYENLQCPRKNLVELLHSGHDPFLDDPASFCSALKNILNEVH